MWIAWSLAPWGNGCAVSGRHSSGAPADTLATRATDAERYDPRVDRWSPLAPLLLSGASHSACAIDEHTAVILDGLSKHDERLAAFQAYDARADRWWFERRWALPRPTFAHTAVVML